MGNIEDAVRAYEDLLSEEGNLPTRFRIDAGTGLSWVYYTCGDMDKAISVGDGVRLLSLQNGGYQLPKIEHNFGFCLLAKGESRRAMDLWERTLQDFTRTSQPAEQANVLESMATCHLEVGNNPDEAERCAHLALVMINGLSQMQLCARLYRVLGQVEQHRPRFEHERSWYQLALSAFEMLQAQLEIKTTVALMRSIPARVKDL